MRLFHHTTRFLLLLSVIGLVYACAPVNMLTHTKRVPRQYSENYNYPNVKSERSELNRQPWVVHSDRDGNVTTLKPGGSLSCKELKYMEPMYVVGRKGNYYKLIKYNPAALGKKGGLVKVKQAEFYGWIDKDLLLLFNNSETEVRNGIKLKSLAAIEDCGVMLEAEKYFKSDSLTLYSDPKFEKACGSLGVNSVVYVLKRADNGAQVLIAQKTSLSPDDVAGMTVGWVDARLVAPFGQRLVFSVAPDTIHAPVSVTPALYADRTDSTLVFRTLDASQILDHSPNRIYNVDGAAISYNQSRQISSQLNDINVIFAFVPTTHVVQQMPMLLNAIQNLKPIFEKPFDKFHYNYAATIGGQHIDFNSDYLSFSDRLIEAGQHLDTVKSAGFISTLRSGIALAAQHPQATNIVVLVGERVPARDSLSKAIYNDFVRCNGRLLSYQVYADNADTYNNFVLRSLDLIETYSKRYQTLKRKVIVYTDQLHADNIFSEGAKNVWSLDFPKQSMTQGMVIFPEKGKFTDPELLIGGMDSLVRQVELDNRTLASSLDRAFAQAGQHLSRFQPAVAKQLGLDSLTKIAPYIGKAFSETSPQWVQITDRISMPVDSTHLSALGLLLTETELKDIKTWVGDLASMKPDKKGDTSAEKARVQSVKKVRKALRGVPADMATVQIDTADSVADSLPVQYTSTGKIRKHVQKLYLKALRKCVFEGNPRRMTLAEAQETITTLPTLTPTLNTLTLKDLKKKGQFTDAQLDLLIAWFDKHKELLESQPVAVPDLTIPNGEKFFFLPVNAMP